MLPFVSVLAAGNTVSGHHQHDGSDSARAHDSHSHNAKASWTPHVLSPATSCMPLVFLRLDMTFLLVEATFRQAMALNRPYDV